MSLDFTFDLPFDGDSSFAGRTSILSANSKPPIENILTKTSPAYISVVGYKQNANFQSRNLGDVVATSDKFFLQAIGEARQEKVQVMETFGAPSILFFNERTRVYNFRGTMLDAKQKQGTYSDQIVYNWATAFKMFYEEYLRGSILSKENNIAILTVNDQVFMGYPTSLTINTDANQPMLGGFQMTWIIIRQYYLPPANIIRVEDPGQRTEQIKTYYDNLRKLYSADSLGVGAIRLQIEDLKKKKSDLQAELVELRVDLEVARGADDASVLLNEQITNTEPNPQLVELAKSIDEKEAEIRNINAQILSLYGGN